MCKRIQESGSTVGCAIWIPNGSVWGAQFLQHSICQTWQIDTSIFTHDTPKIAAVSQWATQSGRKTDTAWHSCPARRCTCDAFGCHIQTRLGESWQSVTISWHLAKGSKGWRCLYLWSLDIIGLSLLSPQVLVAIDKPCHSDILDTSRHGIAWNIIEQFVQHESMTLPWFDFVVVSNVRIREGHSGLFSHDIVFALSWKFLCWCGRLAHRQHTVLFEPGNTMQTTNSRLPSWSFQD